MSQIDLFTRRARRLPTPKESELHFTVAHHLRKHCLPQWRYTHIGHGEKRDKRTAMKLKNMGVVAGWPDFIFVGRAPFGNAVFFLELKRKGGKPSPEQADLAAHLMRCGCGYLCTDNFDDVVAALVDFGITRRMT